VPDLLRILQACAGSRALGPCPPRPWSASRRSVRWVRARPSPRTPRRASLSEAGPGWTRSQRKGFPSSASRLKCGRASLPGTPWGPD